MKLKISSFLFLLLSSVSLYADPPKAVIKGADAVPVGGLVLLDARESNSALPLAWDISPAGDDAIFITADKGGRTDVLGFFSAQKEGTYDIVLVAIGHAGDEKSPVVSNVAVKRIVVGNPRPPGPPIPTDPLQLAAYNFKDDVLRNCSGAYAIAQQSLLAKNSFQDTQKNLVAGMKQANQQSFVARFAPWKPLLPPDGTEPTNDAQWKAAQDLMGALKDQFFVPAKGGK